jgi:hypothetical protein
VQANILSFQMAMLQRRFASSMYACAAASSACATSGRRSSTTRRSTGRSRSTAEAPRGLRRPDRGRAGKIMTDARRSRPHRRPGALREEIQRLDKLVDRRASAREARDRVEAPEAPAGAQRAEHLQRPEDEAAHLHRAQGHARLPRRRRRDGRPAGQAARVGPHRHPDPRRDADRRPRHAEHPHLRRARVPRGAARSSSRPRRPAKASTCSSAG